MKPALKSPEPTLWQLRYDGQLSNFVFNFNLRRYSKGGEKEKKKAKKSKAKVVEF